MDLKILGVGTAAAVLIDATVVRGTLLPAALALLGDRAWPRRALARGLSRSPAPPRASSAGCPLDARLARQAVLPGEASPRPGITSPHPARARAG